MSTTVLRLLVLYCRYDTRAEKKVRTPAWCDRILWRTAPSGATLTQTQTQIQLLDYGRSPLNASDHKPVFAVFDCSFKRVAEKKEKQVW